MHRREIEDRLDRFTVETRRHETALADVGQQLEEMAPVAAARAAWEHDYQDELARLGTVERTIRTTERLEHVMTRGLERGAEISDGIELWVMYRSAQLRVNMLAENNASGRCRMSMCPRVRGHPAPDVARPRDVVRVAARVFAHGRRLLPTIAEMPALLAVAVVRPDAVVAGTGMPRARRSRCSSPGRALPG